MNHYVVYLKLIKCCVSTIPQLKKKSRLLMPSGLQLWIWTFPDSPTYCVLAFSWSLLFSIWHFSSLASLYLFYLTFGPCCWLYSVTATWLKALFPALLPKFPGSDPSRELLPASSSWRAGSRCILVSLSASFCASHWARPSARAVDKGGCWLPKAPYCPVIDSHPLVSYH